MNTKTANKDLGRPDAESFRKQVKRPVAVILDNVRSLLNVGSVFRTSDAFAIEQLLLCGITGTPPNKEIHKSALGSEDTVSWKKYDSTLDAVRQLRTEGYIIYAVEQTKHAVLLDSLTIPENIKIALVFGNEVDGVDQEVINNCDACIEIPQEGTKHSLNIAVSVGVVLWEVRNKLEKKAPVN